MNEQQTFAEAVQGKDWDTVGDMIGQYTQWPIDDIQDWLSHGDWEVIRSPQQIAAEWDKLCADADRLIAAEWDKRSADADPLGDDIDDDDLT